MSAEPGSTSATHNGQSQRDSLGNKLYETDLLFEYLNTAPDMNECVMSSLVIK